MSSLHNPNEFSLFGSPTSSPHPGHEFPFSVKMSHIRDGGSSAGGLAGGAVRDPSSPTDCPGVLLLDQCLPPDNQCQFILKPNRALLGQAPLTGETAGESCGVNHILWLHESLGGYFRAGN